MPFDSTPFKTKSRGVVRFIIIRSLRFVRLRQVEYLRQACSNHAPYLRLHLGTLDLRTSLWSFPVSEDDCLQASPSPMVLKPSI